MRQRVDDGEAAVGEEPARAAPLAPRVFTDMDNLLGEYYRKYQGGVWVQWGRVLVTCVCV